MLFVFCLIMYHPLKYPNGKNYPIWAELFGFFLSACSMIVIPIYALFYLFIKPKSVSLKEVIYFFLSKYFLSRQIFGTKYFPNKCDFY